MRISDWSSDVCSSDLSEPLAHRVALALAVLHDDLDVPIGVDLLHPPAFFERAVLAVTFDVDHLDILGEARHAADRRLDIALFRSEERRVGKECVSTCRSRWSPYH